MRWCWLLVMAACSFQHGSANLGGGPGSDGSGSALPDAGRRDAPADTSGRHDASPDAATDLCAADSLLCAGEGGVCASGTCVITIATGSVNVTCPPGMPCRIDCTTNSACKSATLSCGAATECTIDCQATNSCQSANFDCRTHGCTVDCRASNTCMNDSIGCSPSTCTFECCANNTCSNNSGDMPVYDVVASCPP